MVSAMYNARDWMVLVGFNLPAVTKTRWMAFGVAVLLVEQEVEAALEIADRVAFIENGAIRRLSTPAALAADPAPLHRYVGVRR